MVHYPRARNENWEAYQHQPIETPKTHERPARCRRAGIVERARAFVVILSVVAPACSSLAGSGGGPQGPGESDYWVIVLRHAVNAELRSDAAYALGSAGCHAAVRQLLDAVEDESAKVRATAVGSLSRLDSQLSRSEAEADKAKRKQIAEMAAEPFLRLVREDPSANVRCAAARALGQLEVDKALPVLVGLASSEDPDLRQASIEALWLLGARTEKVRAVIRQALLDPVPAVVISASVAWQRMVSREELLAEMRKWLHEDKWQHRLTAVGVLSNLGEADALGLLAARVDDKNVDVALEAILGLAGASARHADSGQQGRCVGALIEAMEDPRPEVAATAANVLSDVGSTAAAADSRRAFDALLAATSSSRPRVAASACNGLGRFKSFADASMPVLRKALGSSDLPLACQAAHALGHLGRTEAVPALVDALTRTSMDPVVKRVRWWQPAGGQRLYKLEWACRVGLQSAAIQALGRCRDRRAVTALIDLLETTGFGRTRVECTGALGQIGGDRAVRAVRRVSREDPVAYVRCQARIVLARLGR